jgi:hypothetical protein
MPKTDDKAIAGRNVSVDDNINTRDQRRVGIWFGVITALAIAGLFALGGGHSPKEHDEAGHDTSGTGSRMPLNANPPNFDVNRPVGVVEWPGMVGQSPKYLTGKGNTPADAKGIQQGQSIGVSPNTAIDQQSRERATSGAAPSDTMPPPGTSTESGGGAGGATGGH